MRYTSPALKNCKDSSKSRYFKRPIEVGDKVEGTPVKEMGIHVETPYQIFDKASLIESRTEFGATDRSDFVKGFDEVKREFIMKEGEQEYIVTSGLRSIE